MRRATPCVRAGPGPLLVRGNPRRQTTGMRHVCEQLADRQCRSPNRFPEASRSGSNRQPDTNGVVYQCQSANLLYGAFRALENLSVIAPKRRSRQQKTESGAARSAMCPGRLDIRHARVPSRGAQAASNAEFPAEQVAPPTSNSTYITRALLRTRPAGGSSHRMIVCRNPKLTVPAQRPYGARCGTRRAAAADRGTAHGPRPRAVDQRCALPLPRAMRRGRTTRRSTIDRARLSASGQPVRSAWR